MPCSTTCSRAHRQPFRARASGGVQHSDLLNGKYVVTKFEVKPSRSTTVRTHAAATGTKPSVAEELGVTSDDVGTAISREEHARWNSMWVSCPIERAYVVPQSDIKGEIPADLRGTLLRNGPGNFDVGPGQRIQHPFDGDGVVTSYSFNGDGEVVLRRKFVRTQAQQEEMSAGKLMYKGAFTVGDPSGEWAWPFPLKMRKSANVHVLWWANKALALYDRDLPHVMDATLATEGKSTLGVWEKEDVMAGHHRVVAEDDGTQRLCTFSSGEAGLDLTTKILELDEQGNKIHETETKIKDAAFGFVHDFLVTENYYIIVENPTRMDFWKLMTQYTFGKACIAECLYQDVERPMKVHCIPRPGKNGSPRPAYEVSSKFAFHHANAWDTDNGTTIVVDTFANNKTSFGGVVAGDNMDRFTDSDKFTTLRRLVLRGDEVKGSEYDFREVEALEGKFLELPSPLPAWQCGRPHSAVLALGSRDVPSGQTGLGQCVTRVSYPPGLGVSEPWDTSKVTVSQYYAGDGRYTQEPVFVPKSQARRDTFKPFDGQQGWILVQVNDMRDTKAPRTCLEILDAENLEGGPVAVIQGQELIPSGFHGSWTDTCMPAQPGETLPYENDIRISL